MTLKRYLLIVFLTTYAGFVLIGGIMTGVKGAVGMLMVGPIFALANTFINVWPWANMVPVERRTSIRAYKWTNVFMAVWLLALTVLAGFKLVEVLVT